MRLRSSKFVFLLLLVCSVRDPQVYAQGFMAGPALGRTILDSQQRENDPSGARRVSPRPQVRQAPRETGLDPASLAAHVLPWGMRSPASASAAVVSFTGYQRG